MFGVPGGQLVLIFVGDVWDGYFVVFEHAKIGIAALTFCVVGREIHIIWMQRPHVVGVGKAEVFVEAVAERQKLG